MLFETVQWLCARVSDYALSAVSSREGVTAALGEIGGIFTRLTSGLAWPYVLASVTIAGGWYLLSTSRGVWSVQSCAAFFFPSRVFTHPSAKVDYRFYAVSLLCNVFFIFPLLMGFQALAEKIGQATLANPLGWLFPGTLSVPALFAAALGFYLLHDFMNYWSHVLLHKVPLLWVFHQVHHSAEVLTPASAYRAHPVEFFVTMILRMPLIGLMYVFYQAVPAQETAVTTIFGVSLVAFMYGLSGFHLQHSHLPISYGPVLNRLIVSPIVHQTHHSIDPRHHDKNFGVKLALWDWLFGTLYVPDRHERLQFGLAGNHHDDFSTVGKLYGGPFRRADRIMRQRCRSVYLRAQAAVRSGAPS